MRQRLLEYATPVSGEKNDVSSSTSRPCPQTLRSSQKSMRGTLTVNESLSIFFSTPSKYSISSVAMLSPSSKLSSSGTTNLIVSAVCIVIRHSFPLMSTLFTLSRLLPSITITSPILAEPDEMELTEGANRAIFTLPEAAPLSSYVSFEPSKYSNIKVASSASTYGTLTTISLSVRLMISASRGS